MGKGSRNRQLHQDYKAENPQKYKPKKVKKPMPKWVSTTICIVLLVGVLFGVGAYIFNAYGIIGRTRIILESKTGEFDVNQQIATYFAWQNVYYEASLEWLYMKYGLIEDTQGITKQGADTYIEQGDYAIYWAKTYLESNLRDAIDMSLDLLKELVAVCDEAYTKGVGLDENDKEEVQASIDSLTSLALNYGYVQLSTFLSDHLSEGILESDIETAVEMSTLYNKYKTQIQSGMEENLTEAEWLAYLAAHPEEFYKLDYLSFTTDSEEFAKKLTAADVTNADQLKEMILRNHFEKNYKTVYNKYVTQGEMTALYNSVKKLSDSDGKTELSDKLTEIGVDPVKTIEKTSVTDEALSKWLFDTARKQYDVATFANKEANGIYLVAFYSAEANQNTVEARVLFREFVDGDSYGEDTKFKENVLTYLLELKKDSTEFPKVDYTDAATKGNDLKAECEALATNAERKAYLQSLGAITKKEVTIDATEEQVPTALRDHLASLSLTEKDEDKIYVATSGALSYVVYILSVDEAAERWDILYTTVDADPYYQIVDALTTSLNGVYPTDKTANLTFDAKEGTFEAWISARGENATVSARKEFDSTYISSSTTDANKNTVYSYTVYMVVKEQYLDETHTVNGGYVPFYGKVNNRTAYEQAQDALAKMTGKKYAAAVAAMNSLGDSTNNISPTISSTITKESLTSYAQLKTWFFEEKRAVNDMAVLGTEGKNEIYLALYLGEGPAWENQAKDSTVSEKMTNWLNSLTSAYTVNESALNAIGEPTTTTAAA